MLALAVYLMLGILVQLSSAAQVGECDPNRSTNQYLRDDSNRCYFYQCEFQNSPHLRARRIKCPSHYVVPTNYGVGIPDTLNPCRHKSYNKWECEESGSWSQWSSWSRCSATCGKGRQGRTRQCRGPSGVMCPGLLREDRDCMIRPCYGEYVEKDFG
ncbi:semaphorin-5B [Lingula anatina]|uniref:Semaphorin-5B n=1 Tax=Lingula anatina TaxID=7574 RepID=A0A1S3IYB5_LINAN|nr:semaphorin-5B [Lingula anatina]|eukprot:XP_013402539.1 semaphorin-5B [Lingula anatina]